MMIASAAARAQDYPGDVPDEPVAPAVPVGVTPDLGVQQVSLKIDQFGTGDVSRGGGWVMVIVEFSDDASDKPRDLVFRLTLPDPDGDTVHYERSIAANPGVRQKVWLYAWLPFSQLDRPITITAHEAVERDTGPDGVSLTAGRQLGKIDALPTRTRFGPGIGLLGVVGRSEAGLGQYTRSLAGGSNFAPTGHELTDVVAGLLPAMLPDRWQGYAQFESLIWTGSSLEYQPSRLNLAQAAALREWIRRGGHLVVIVPSVGQTWLTGTGDAQTGGNNPLGDLMPAVLPRRQENVDLNRYATLLTRQVPPKKELPVLPTAAVVHELMPLAIAGAYDAMPILVGPGPDDQTPGAPLVVRKLYGHGAVSLIGIDLSQTALATSPSLRAEQIWHRVLGRRYDLVPPRASGSSGSSGVGAAAPVMSRTTTNLDDMVGPTIEKSGQAAAGLLLAVIVFAAYWFVAGLGSYAFLSKKNRKQHAWVAFVGATAVFTAIAWGGAAMIKIRRVEGQHLTILDHVYGQTGQRAREWATIFLPTYGDRTIAIMPQPDADANGGSGGANAASDVLAAFEPPRDAYGSGGGTNAFPDARAYTVDCRRPDSMTVPSRSTVKQITADWFGAIPREWEMIRPLPETGQEGDDVPLGREIELIDKSEAEKKLGKLTDRAFKIKGDLTHNLPASLENVTIVLVVQQTDPKAQPYDLQAMTYAIKLRDAWKPGVRHDLETLIPLQQKLMGDDPGELNKLLLDLLLRQTPSFGGVGERNAGSPERVQDEILGLSFFNVLANPSQTKEGEAGAVRSVGYGLDLSRWITQPCLIVIGTMNDTPGPVPISVEGEDVRQRINAGRTIVRWVYPLAPKPPVYKQLSIDSSAIEETPAP